MKLALAGALIAVIAAVSLRAHLSPADTAATGTNHATSPSTTPTTATGYRLPAAGSITAKLAADTNDMLTGFATAPTAAAKWLWLENFTGFGPMRERPTWLLAALSPSEHTIVRFSALADTMAMVDVTVGAKPWTVQWEIATNEQWQITSITKTPPGSTAAPTPAQAATEPGQIPAPYTNQFLDTQAAAAQTIVDIYAGELPLAEKIQKLSPYTLALTTLPDFGSRGTDVTGPAETTGFTYLADDRTTTVVTKGKETFYITSSKAATGAWKATVTTGSCMTRGACDGEPASHGDGDGEPAH